MTSEEFRHELTKEQRRMTDAELAKTLEPGIGISVHRAAPYWDVVARIGDKSQVEFIVTDSSREGQKPLLVHGPIGRAEAIVWANNEAAIWRATHVSHVDDEPLSQFRGDS